MGWSNMLNLVCHMSGFYYQWGHMFIEPALPHSFKTQLHVNAVHFCHTKTVMYWNKVLPLIVWSNWVSFIWNISFLLQWEVTWAAIKEWEVFTHHNDPNYFSFHIFCGQTKWSRSIHPPTYISKWGATFAFNGWALLNDHINVSVLF